jgi:hypothetical protein
MVDDRSRPAVLAGRWHSAGDRRTSIPSAKYIPPGPCQSTRKVQKLPLRCSSCAIIVCSLDCGHPKNTRHVNALVRSRLLMGMLARTSNTLIRIREFHGDYLDHAHEAPPSHQDRLGPSEPAVIPRWATMAATQTAADPPRPAPSLQPARTENGGTVFLVFDGAAVVPWAIV